MTTKKATYKNVHSVLQDYIKRQDLTKLCRELKKKGVVKRSEILSAFNEHYTRRYLTGKKISAYEVAFCLLKNDLDNKEQRPECYTPQNFVKRMKENKAAGNYKKVLIEGNKHIFWASPIYGHADYNKSIWRENTADNRAKMEIINNYLNK